MSNQVTVSCGVCGGKINTTEEIVKEAKNPFICNECLGLNKEDPTNLQAAKEQAMQDFYESRL